MRGFTLIELIVAIAVLSVTLGVSVPALWRMGNPEGDVTVLAAARTRAAILGKPVRVWLPEKERGDSVSVVLLPDGRAAGPAVDPLSGRRINAAY